VNGRYTIQGMRTGGPYKVEITYVGYQKNTYNDIYLELGNTYTLNAEMKESSEVLKEVVVTGTPSKKLLTGAGHNFTTNKIEETPTVDRNIYDIVKNMPMAQTNKIGGISFAGSNNRYNSFQIDGTVSNDVFGLTASGTNGGQSGANPISMDAIQEIQVVVSPFDVRQSGFTGGGINAITKQGTNMFHGSAYTYYTNQNMYGRYNANNERAKEKLDKQHTTTYGFTLGGPIIKDKLFFFGSLEKISETYPSRYYPGSGNYKSFTTDLADQIISRYKSLTGIEESYGSRDVDQSSLGILARIDWNINANNKFAFRYQHNNSSSDVYGSGSGSYYFNNSAYQMKNKTNSFVAELNSHLSNALYNEFRASMTFVRDHREVPYQAPCVWIKSNAADGYVGINLGTEYSSGANRLNQNIYTFEDNLSWYLGNHTLTFGTHNEFFHMKNQFVQANNGEWVYTTIDNFLNDVASQFVYKYADPENFIPEFNAGQFGFYAQDKWETTKNLTLTLGLRFDIPKVFDDPTTNDTFNTYAAGKNLDAVVGRMPSTKVMFSPRFGFRWYLDDAHKTLLRGGLGLFTGRVPFVWLSNCFTNDGVEQKGTTISKNVPSMTQYAKDPKAAATSGTLGKPDICTVQKDFKYPQVFRTDLALEQNLPYDIKLTVEGLYSKTLNNVYFKNLALAESGKTYAISGNETSAVPHYSVESSNYYSIIDLENTSKGYTYSFSAMLEKSFDFGLNMMASYTFGHSKSIFDGTSSVAYSNWKYNYATDSNHPDLSYSTFDIPNRIVASIGYTTPKYANGLLNTNVSLYYTGSNGMRYSLTMNESTDYNGDGQYGNSLLYIPTQTELASMTFVDQLASDKKTVTMTADQSRTNFENWIESNNYAKDHRGQYAKRNGCQAPWENRIDLHIAENIFVCKNCEKYNGTKLQLTFDVINFANMLNKRWGNNYGSTYNVMPLQVSKVTNNVASFIYNSNNTVKRSDVYSRWHAQIGVKFTF
jgi:outer membrane receptor for ferrienterochelin and colicin